MSGFQSGLSGSYGGVASGQTPDDEDSGGPGLIGQILGSQRFGFMVARAGVQQLTEEMKTQSAEQAAASDGDVNKYIDLRKSEMSGVVGEAREATTSFFDDLSKPENAGEKGLLRGLTLGASSLFDGRRANDASEADIEAGNKNEQREERKVKGQEYDAKLDEHVDAMNEQVLESGTQGSADRELERSKFEYKKAMDEAAKVEMQSDDKFASPQEHKRIVAEMRDAAGRKEGVDEYKAAEDQDRGVLDLEHEAKRADMRMAGDDDGAKRSAFMDSVDKKSQEEHGKSQKEGDVFDQQVKPELIKQYDQQVQQQRVEDERRTQDEITKIQQGAEIARLQAAGQGYEADRDAHMAALNEKIEQTQAAADNETNVVKKAQLQRVADATKQAGYVEGKAFDDNHDREDQDRAKGMQLKFSGNTEQAEEYEADQQFKKDGDKAVRDERIKEAKYKEEQAQQDRDVREDQSAARAQGKGELADYEGLRAKEDKDIKAAELTGDPAKIAQAKRTAANDIQAYEKEHQDKGETFNSNEDFSNHLMHLGGGNGLQDAMKMAAQDAKDLKGGGDLQDKQHAAADKHHSAASKTEQAMEKLLKALENKAEFIIAHVT